MRVELSMRGDYAVRAMLALAADDGARPLSAGRIAAKMGIPGPFLPHVLHDLAAAGLVIARAGRSGGYRLATAADRIDLLQVIEAVEGGAPARCVLRGGPCRPDGKCAVHDVFANATAAMRATLASVTLADLVVNPGAFGSPRLG